MMFVVKSTPAGGGDITPAAHTRSAPRLILCRWYVRAAREDGHTTQQVKVTIMTLEQRVEALEKEVSSLKEQLILLNNETSHSVIQLQKAIENAKKEND
jgi:predicted RNase H-like nuclease (RuvC/YqgF family)